MVPANVKYIVSQNILCPSASLSKFNNIFQAIKSAYLLIRGLIL